MNEMIPPFMIGWLNGATMLTMTSPFGPRKLKDDKKVRQHKGIDFRAAVGTPVYAPIGAQVIKCNRTGRGGEGISLYMRFYVGEVSYTIILMHLSKILIETGVRVTQGTKIAETGKTGHSFGPHLHFEIHRGLQPFDPLYLFSESIRNAKTGKIAWKGRQAAASAEEIVHTQSEYADKDVTNDTVETETEYEEELKPSFNTSQTVGERLALGIWQITKLLMDSSVSHRQIFDSSIALQTGPLINFFRKVCQMPLVELSGDTYGDQYYFMVRRPPFDHEGIRMMQDAACLVIEEREIISTDITWTTQGIYSWYQLIPYGELGGTQQMLLYMPAVFFPEYASVWGSKDLTVQSQYVNFFLSGYFNQKTDAEKKANGERIIRNAVTDLKYLVESNAYNPFTRQGTITLNGDRRIKRGMLVVMPNGEQFYVDGVSNSISYGETSVIRTTTLQVSHGMFQEYIPGVEVNGELMSYFNLINFGADFDVSKITSETWPKAFAEWKVNTNVFAFFLKRSQILSSYQTGKIRSKEAE